MQLDTKHTSYVGTDAVNGTLQVLVPRNSNLQLDAPDNTNAAEYRLLETAMDNTRIDL